MTVSDYKNLSKEDQEKYLASLTTADKAEFLTEVEEYDWLEALNEATAKQGEDISKLLGCAIEPFLFVIVPCKDAAVGFFKTPDAKQAFKLLREVGLNYDNGTELIAKAQLVRKGDLEARSSQGDASDPRFMDANGSYPMGEDKLNMNLLRRAQKLVSLYSDEFKKK